MSRGVILNAPVSPEVAAARRAGATARAQPDAINHELKAVPDRELVATLVAHGQPLWSARQAMSHPQARFHALRFWCDVQDAAEGDKRAQERVDYLRAMWDVERQIENISDDPSRGYGHIHDPRELL